MAVIEKVDIEQLLIWAVRTEQAGHNAAAINGKFQERLGYGLSLSAVSVNAAQLGCARIDGRSGHPDENSHPDALTIVQRLFALAGSPGARLAMQHAQLADQPDWFNGPLRTPGPVYGKRNQGPSEKQQQQTLKMPDPQSGKIRSVRVEVRFSPIEWIDNAAMAEWCRDDYGSWWEALADLTDEYFRRVVAQRFEVVGFEAPRWPWLERDADLPGGAEALAAVPYRNWIERREVIGEKLRLRA